MKGRHAKCLLESLSMMDLSLLHVGLSLLLLHVGRHAKCLLESLKERMMQ